MSSPLEERLREAAARGELEDVQALLQKGVDVNARDESNGWTCLHWACKRNHIQVVLYLLACGADKEIVTNEGDQAAYLTSKAEIKRMLGVEDDNQEESNLSLPVVANSLTNPLFPCQEMEKVPSISAPQDTSTVISEGDSTPCLSATHEDKDCKSSSLHNETELAEQGCSEGVCGFPTGMGPSEGTKHSVHNCPVYTSSMFHRTLFTSAASMQHIPQRANSSCTDTALPWQPLLLTGTYPYNTQELVLKVRVQNSKEDDFIEIELNRQELTYPDLLRVSSSELGVNPEQVKKIRKLPNTLDEDVARLQDFQELELVLGKTIRSSFTNVAASLIERPCYNIKAAKLTY
ncbi:ankyrin repeat domain-containing protein 40-like isoform X2 [Eublepharis macularius]|uniref:Ankyrin repeat domain-containing protein 40-like isoform X2 n=1 Tax=Eublepharis macularius TaxID=481883 RepID=A0AA97KYG7_EUBMA|nr:ankyrin repeat domain-containing protein 40-like isoform X2 [Eublepharis macularius]